MANAKDAKAWNAKNYRGAEYFVEKEGGSETVCREKGLEKGKV